MDWDGLERRDSCRVLFLCRLRVDYRSRLLVSHTENVGDGGVKIFLKEKLEPGTIIDLQIVVGTERIIKCKGKVVWVIERGDHIEGQPPLFDAGIKFTEIDNSDRQYIRKLIITTRALEKKQKELKNNL